jgi:NTP pyrophosphatase (non-canonical NTP hydrolase)
MQSASKRLKRRKIHEKTKEMPFQKRQKPSVSLSLSSNIKAHLQKRHPTTTMSDFHSLQQRITAFRDARDWAQFHTPRHLASAISIESAELLEAFLWKTDDQVDPKKLSEDLADIMIYCTLMCDRLGVDPLTIMSEKLDRNEQKYPVEKAKGNAKKYTEL